MTPTGIRWLLYDLQRQELTRDQIQEVFEIRGVSYDDLVDFILFGEKL